MGMILKVAYDGTFYGGMAKQPDLETIEGVFEKVIRDLGYREKIRFLSRTDRGVHAVSQLILLRGNDKNFVKVLSARLPFDIIIHSFSIVSERFNLYRMARNKVYLYIAPSFDENEELIRWGCEYISSGTHDFRGLSKRRNVIEETIMNVKIKFRSDDFFQFFYVIGKSFLWEQVRRIVTSLKYLGLKKISKGDFKHLLKGYYLKKGIPPAPAEGLILWNVEIDVDWLSIVPENFVRKYIIEVAKKNAILHANSWVI